jgi:hypothetical protein
LHYIRKPALFYQALNFGGGIPSQGAGQVCSGGGSLAQFAGRFL